jgi:phosphoserine aminotransferase
MRKHNFSAGPSTLPLPVLQEIQDEIVDYKGTGLSIIEASHRGKEYDEIHHHAMEGVRSAFAVPASHQILFLAGGATLQFGMIPMNFLTGNTCGLVKSGSWAKKALSDAKKIGQVNVLFDGADSNFTTLPQSDQLNVDSGLAYLHLTSNETIEGLQWKEFPQTGDVPLIADMSSDIMSRPVDVGEFDLIYAGAQKNLGPAGATLVIISNDLLTRCPETLPAYLSYKTHAEKDSLYNTPPVFSIYAIAKVLDWIADQGGLTGIAARNERKAKIVYDAIARNNGFYTCPVDAAYRSTMNVVFRLPNEDLEKQFVAEAAKNDMIGLKGHRSVGGIRASLYNALPEEGATALSAFMDSFAASHG